MAEGKPLASIAVVGAGAVGCYFGGMFARAGHPVTFIGRPAHVAAMQRDGLFFDGLRICEHIPVHASTELAAVRGADIILFCVKTLDTEATARAVAPYVDAGTLVVSLQNGVENAERIEAASGLPALSAAVFVGCQMAGPGHLKHVGRGDLVIGWPRDTTPPPTHISAEAFARLAEAADIPCRISPDIAAALWTKLAINAAYNAIAALTDANYGKILDCPPTKVLMHRVLEETVAVASAAGVALDLETVKTMTFALGEGAPGMIASTLQDVRRGKPTEVEDLNGVVVRRGLAFGVPTPINGALQALMKLRDSVSTSASTSANAASPNQGTRNF